MIDYASFLAAKAVRDVPTGLDQVPGLNDGLFPFQRDIVAWALRRGRAAIWADCGLGKTFMQLEWARHVPGRVLILAPLAVARQTVAEGAKFGIDATYAREPVDAQIVVTNYEMLPHFNPADFAGVVLDESSILKSYTGKTRTSIIESFRETPFRLACTATPAPNDYMELGNHSEFLGAMSRTEMLSTFFVHDGGETQKWRLKGHARRDFWRWVSSWAVNVRTPSDLGYDDDGFVLPPVEYTQHNVQTGPTDGYLFAMPASTLQERMGARRDTVQERAEACAAIVNASDEQWVVWCALNAESTALRKMIPDAVEVRGSDSRESKESALLGFTAGDVRVLVTKPSIAGFGMNWQHCARVAFVGLSDSWEQYYQAVRRCWRFGQRRPVEVHIFCSALEGSVVANIQRKELDAHHMAEEMAAQMRDEHIRTVRGSSTRTADEYKTDVVETEDYTVHLGDCVEVVGKLDDDSIGYTIFSPPFASLYTYSASDRDMGNCRDADEFVDHFRFLVRELYRVTQPGRLLSFHCMLLPTSKAHHGYIGLQDFRGELIRVFQDAGWIHHSEVVIWKDPVTAMQRTKALGLLHKQLKKDSCMSRQGIPDYLVTMRKPGTNPSRVSHTNTTFPVELWQQYASPVWMDIDPSDTLQFRSAREHEDERHICPLQLGVIRRALKLWSRPGDLVLSPFTGIGSEGYCAVEMGRRFVGAELKRSYWRQACKNLATAVRSRSQLSLIDGVGAMS